MIRHANRTVCCVAVLALAVSLSEQTDASAQAWPNEPPGSTLLTDFGFSASSGAGWINSYNSPIVNDSTAPQSSDKVLQFQRPIGQTGGGQMDFPLNNASEIYYGYWVKVSNPYDGWLNLFQKLTIIQFASADPANLWVEFYGPRGGDRQLILNLQFVGVNNSHLGSGFGDSPGPWVLFANVGNGTFSHGVWHRVELHAKKSTTTTSRDGILKLYLDGQLISTHTTVNFPNGPMALFQFTPSWDSGDPTQTNVDYQWFDHVRISRPSGGGGNSNGDTTPPVPPVNLRVN